MGMFDSFFHPEKAYKKAAKERKNAFNQGLGYEQPFWQQGMDQYNDLMGAKNALLDPAALYNKWAQGYEESPYAKQLLEKNKASGMDLASQYGLSGSSAAMGNIQQGAGEIVAKDRQQYLNDLMQKYMAGIGLGSNIYGIGAQMGGQIGNQYNEMGQDLAQYKYGEQAAPGQLFENILGNFSNLFGNQGGGGAGGGGAGGSNVWAQLAAGL